MDAGLRMVIVRTRMHELRAEAAQDRLARSRRDPRSAVAEARAGSDTLSRARGHGGVGWLVGR